MPSWEDENANKADNTHVTVNGSLVPKPPNLVGREISVIHSLKTGLLSKVAVDH